MCGFPAAPGHWTEAGADTPQSRIRSRFRRGELLNAVLRSYGLSAHDGGVIPGIQLQTLSGQQEIVPDLEAIWPAAERLVGRAIDPLDPGFLGVDGAYA
jgi:hypothetical protein